MHTETTEAILAEKGVQATIVDTSRSAHALLRPVGLGAVRLADDFWAPRLMINRSTTLPSQFQHCEETGRLDNFRRASGKKTGIPFQGIYFNDSDIYKWLEAAAWTMATEQDAALEAMVETAIAEVAAAQQPDGYLDTYFMFEKAAERWSNLRDMHELYCAGHLIQAAVAHHRATGREELLAVARKLADHICDTFGPPESGKTPGVCGHQEIEMALVELARDTGDERYLQQALYFIDARGHGLIGGKEYHQDHQPFRELERMTGHAVRAVYMTAGAADLLLETGDASLRGTLDRLWTNMTTRQLYVSGGIGSRYEGEAFGKDFELPNERAYTETCAAIGSVMWNWRLLALEGDARYADLLETTLYNAVLPGLSLDGQTYFYQNPLADDGTHRREAWFGCACCPPNVARMLASLPGYFYSVSDDTVWVHLFAEGSATISLEDGRAIELTQQTRYPWDGDIAIKIGTTGTFALRLRVPAWCTDGASATINGQQSGVVLTPGEYLELRRDWQAGDTIRLSLPMPIQRVECHPAVAENSGRVALVRGPLLYCVEQADNPEINPRDVVLPVASAIDSTYEPELLGGVVALRFDALLADPGKAWEGQLYRIAASSAPNAGKQTASITAIPYYAWANREAGPMQVWLRSE